MNFSVKVFEKTFKDKISKNAYLKACKWLAKNVFGKVELSKNISVMIEKDEKGKFPAFTVKLFAMFDKNEIKEEHCKKCRQLHTIFYSRDGVPCDKCEFLAYERRVESETKNRIKFYEEVFEKYEE